MKRLTTPLTTLLFLALAITYWQIDVIGAVTGKFGIFGAEDLYTLYYPLIHYGVSSIKALHIPLWNPYQSLGAPFLGSALFGLFSPFSFLYYILPVHLAMAYSTMMNIALAGLFTFIFLRHSFKIGTAAAITGSLVFMFSGSFLLRFLEPSLLGAMAFLPLILFLTHKVFSTGEVRWALFFALVLACQVLTGAAQVIIHTIFMTGAYTLTLLWLRRKDGKAGLRPLYLLLIGGAIALALSSLQWLPLLELSGLTSRNASGLSLKDVDIFKDFTSPRLIAKAVLFGGGGCIYIGFIPALLGLVAFLNRRLRPYALFFAFIAILSLFLAFGTHTPIYGIYYHYIPTGKMFRVPSRWLWLTGFSVAILTAMGYDKILNGLGGRRGLRTTIIIIIPFIITAFLFHYNVMGIYNHPQKTPDIFTRHSREGAFLRKVPGSWRTYIINDFANDYSLLKKFGTLEKVFVLNDYESLSLDSYRKFVAAVGGKKALLSQQLFTGSYNIRRNWKNLRLLNMLSVGLIMENEKYIFGEGQPRGMHEIYRKDGLKIYRNNGALPRAYVVYNSETITDEGDALKRLASPSFNPRNTVILDRDTGLGQKNNLRLKKADITNFLPERIEISANLRRKGILVLTDFFYPGWQAFVDGEKRPIIRANTIMRGLVLEKGQHKVVFLYRPLPFRVGLWSSILTLLGVIIYLGLDMKRRRSTKPPCARRDRW